MLELLRRDGSDLYPQSMFWSKIKKNISPCAPQFYCIIKKGLWGYTFHGHVFLMNRSDHVFPVSINSYMYPMVNIFYIFSEDTSKYHRAIVLADSHSIYLADVRCLTAVFSTYQHTQIYSTSKTIKFIAVDMVDRKIFFATDTDISYVVIDMDNPREEHVVTSQYDITGQQIMFKHHFLQL